MDEVNQALHKIARGTGIIFMGTIISMTLGFASRTLLARFFSTSQYGVFNLALTIFSINLTVATLGLPAALPREIGFYRKKDPSKMESIISTSLVIVTISSTLGALILALASGDIAGVFQEPRLNSSLRILALALPFSALTGVLIAISQGFGRVREKVYFQNIIYPLLWLTLVELLVGFSFPFEWVFYAYITAQILRFLTMMIDINRLKLIRIQPRFNIQIGKQLILFSIPLFMSGILSFIMNWTDTLMLGYYKNSEVVGIYNAATPLARLIPVFLNSAAFLYSPIAAQLYAQRKIGEIKRLYQVLTKWIFMLTLPIFSVMFLFPEATINFLFSSKYAQAAPALQILSFGFMFHTILGLNGTSIIVMGKTRFFMIANFISAGLNIILNTLLIPQYGANGAALATAVSYLTVNILNSTKLYKITKIHPFYRNYNKVMFTCITTLILFRIMIRFHSKNLNLLWLGFIEGLLILIWIILVIINKSIDKEDIELILAIERSTGIRLDKIREILKKLTRL